MGRPKKNYFSVSKRTGDIMPPKKEADTTCNARVETGYCSHQAGWGTNHVGTGRCKVHGGLSTGRPKKGFMASEFISGDIIRKFEDESNIDPNFINNLDNEINGVKTSFWTYIKECSNQKKLPHPNDVKSFIDSLTKLVSVKSKVEAGSKEVAPAKVIIFYVNQVTNILDKVLQDPLPANAEVLRKRIADAMKDLTLAELENTTHTNGDKS